MEKRETHQHKGVERNSTALFCVFLLLLSGCSGGSLTPPTTRPMFKPDLSTQTPIQTKSPVKALANGLPLAPGITPANNPVTELAIAMADEIVKNAKNPFLSKLPEIKTEATPGANDPTAGEQAIAPPPPADPFEGIKLSGIVYNAKTPIALLGLSTDNTQFAKRGDVVTGDKGTLKVVKITRETVELVDSSNPSNKRIFSLPSIVGYTSDKPSRTGTPAEELDPDSPENLMKDVIQQKEGLKQQVNAVLPPPGTGISGLREMLKNSGLKLQQP